MGTGVLRVFKTKEFERYARREGVSDRQLNDAVRRAMRGLVDADLGGGLIKQRVARPGQGRSGGYRILMAFHARRRTVFVYGFAKNERDNIRPDELNFWREVASSFLSLDDNQLKTMLDAGDIKEVHNDEEDDL